jgi:dTDP-4-dehydrorhamnose reductase
VKILVTGAAGMLGSDVVRAAEFVNHEVVALARSDLDVTDRPAVIRAMLQERPGAVVNCAAYTDVDGAEDDLDAAMDVNAEAAANVAAAAAEIGARVLYPSTDYVFDGYKDGPYVESDEPRPQSIYAQSKLAGEHETTEANPRHYIVRSAWLFGTSGRNFVETMLSLARDHGEVLVVRDQVGCPTYTAHLADALVRLLDTEAYGIHHLASQGECSWYEFALEIFAQSEMEVRVMSCTTDEFGRPAPRPPYSVLGTERAEALYLPHWKEGLASYLAERSVAA